MKIEFDIKDAVIGVVGLGYVGLPLAVEFGKQRLVIGFDINPKRVQQLQLSNDTTLEVTKADLQSATNLEITSDVMQLERCNIFIVTVPTPIDTLKRPDLGPLLSATKAIGSMLKRGDLVIYESTVYPGCTEENCVPLLESVSGLKFNIDFFCGYSPERINPGDKNHRITDIVKVTAGSTSKASKFVDALYREIITAGTYNVDSIKVAEAAKVIENIQRDINIALVNELSIIFNQLGIDTEEVLKAAGTKWNFLNFRPGLVGGHCIGVDPYYLTHKATAIGYNPELINAGRRINDSMGGYVAIQLLKTMSYSQIELSGAKILILGLAFKENCTDIRNSKVTDIITELEGFGVSVDVYDPWVNADVAFDELGISLIKKPNQNSYDGIVLAVGHDVFRSMGAERVKSFGKEQHVIYDVKNVLDKDSSDLRL